MSAIPADLRTASPWRQALPVVVLLVAAILLLHHENVMAMVRIWLSSDTFAHALVVPPISLWLIWRQRERLAATTPRAQPWLLLPLLGVAALWLASDLVVVNAAAQFALVGMLVLAVPATLGWPVARTILFPLLFLFFAVPFGEFMLPTLMNWTADFTVMGLRLSGVPVLRDELRLTIPTGNWSIVEECSGVRYLIASFMVGSLFAYLNYRSYARRALFMLVSLAVPLVANWLRAYMIVMLGHLSGNKIATGVDHIIYGWVFFGIVIMIMFMIGARWAQDEEAFDGGAPQAPSTPEAASRDGKRILLTGLAAALIVLLPHAAVWGLERSEQAAAPVRLSLPAQLAGGWSVQGEGPAPWAPSFLNPSATASRVYAGPGGRVGVYLAYYRGQGPQSKLVSGLNTLVGLNDRTQKQRDGAPVDLAVGDRVVRLRTAEVVDVQDSHTVGSKREVWQAYWVDGRFHAGDAAAKLAGAWARLRGHGDDGAALVVYADAPSVADSRTSLQSFMRANLDPLSDLLTQVRTAR